MITHEHALKQGMILNNYIIVKVLGAGSFGITYLAKDTKLGMQVVIKEYFPSDLAIRKDDSTIISKSSDTRQDYKKGMKRFQEEAQILAKFNHPSIVKILNYFEANDTAYFVMEYEEGIDLSQYLKQNGTPLSQEEILSIMMPILEGLKEVHKYNYLHRDIKPGNILIRNNKPPVLIDFGASKLAIGEASRSITSMLTEGYAPLEQYSTDIKQQGSFTDIYAIGAVIYKMITGEVPPSAQTRSYALLSGGEDPYKALVSMKLEGYDKSFLAAIDRALRVNAKERPQDVFELQKALAGELIYHTDASQNYHERTSYGKYLWLSFVVILTVVSGWYMMEQKKASSLKSDPAAKEVFEKPAETVQPKAQQQEQEGSEIERKKRLEAEEARLNKIREEKKKQLALHEKEIIAAKKKSKEKRGHQYPLADSLEKFLVAFYRSGMSNDISQALAFYTDYTEYYFGKKNVTKKYIARDKKSYYKRWPKRYYHLENYRVQYFSGDKTFGTYVIIARISWKVESASKVLSGESANWLKVNMQDGKFSIDAVGSNIPSKKSIINTAQSTSPNGLIKAYLYEEKRKKTDDPHYYFVKFVATKDIWWWRTPENFYENVEGTFAGNDLFMVYVRGFTTGGTATYVIDLKNGTYSYIGGKARYVSGDLFAVNQKWYLSQGGYVYVDTIVDKKGNLIKFLDEVPRDKQCSTPDNHLPVSNSEVQCMVVKDLLGGADPGPTFQQSIDTKVRYITD